MDYYTTPTKEQVREAAAYVAAHEDRAPSSSAATPTTRLDYYLNAGERREQRLQACKAKDIPKSREQSQRGRLHARSSI